MTAQGQTRQMTALKKYQKLECPGLWRAAPEAQRREVVVGFGESSLVLSDPRTDQALTHWSLPAVDRRNPGGRPALYMPGMDAEETLELDDPDMIAALETVRGALEAALPRPGRLRGWILAGSTAFVLAIGVFWMPGALLTHTVGVVPAATRDEIGAMVLAEVQRLTGAPCDDPLGARAAAELSTRLFPRDPPRLLVMRDGVTGAIPLPDDEILIARALVEAEDGPAAFAGHAIAARARAQLEDPLRALLDHAGTIATFRLLTTGVLPAGAVEGYAEALLQAEPAAVPDEELLRLFAEAKVPSTPYALALDPSGESVLGLIEADPVRGIPAEPLLADGDWVSLQAICAE